jgi:CheY-like chemotaxis protein
MPEGGSVTIEARNVSIESAAPDLDLAPGDYVRVAVTDTGPGMDEATRARAFEPFFTTKATSKGTGLGLSQVYGFARQSGGSAAIVSEPGQGTTVALYLPRTQETPSPSIAAVPASRPKSDAPAERAATILIVEDEPAVLKMAETALSEAGYRTLKATSGPEALDLLKTAGTRIDLLFTDIVLPGGMSGVQLAREAQRRHPKIHTLLTTGYASETLEHADGDGGFETLAKPYHHTDLMARIERILKDVHALSEDTG